MLSASSAGRVVQIGGIICPARGGGWVLPVQTAAAAGCDLLPARASSSRHGKAAHGKRPTEKGNKKEVGAARAVSTSFFASFFRGGYSSGVSSGAGGWNPSRAILSRVAFTIYPATLSPAHFAAVFTCSYSSGINRVATVLNLDKYRAFPARFASVLILSPLSLKVYHTFFFHAT